MHKIGYISRQQVKRLQDLYINNEKKFGKKRYNQLKFFKIGLLIVDLLLSMLGSLPESSFLECASNRASKLLGLLWSHCGILWELSSFEKTGRTPPGTDWDLRDGAEEALRCRSSSRRPRSKCNKLHCHDVRNDGLHNYFISPYIGDHSDTWLLVLVQHIMHTLHIVPVSAHGWAPCMVFQFYTASVAFETVEPSQ